MQIVNALSMQGYLDKESPSFFKMFQKRYFIIRGEGEFLVWFKKKPISIQEEPTGILKIGEIAGIEPCPDEECEFTIKYPERQFLLRASNQDQRNRWVRALQIVINNYQKSLKTKANSGSAKTVPLKPGSNGKSQSWRWNNVDTETNRKVRIEHENTLLQQSSNSILQQSLAFLHSVLPIKNYDVVEKNIMHGFAKKKGFPTDDRRWYFVISEFNLFDAEDEYMNDKVQAIFESANTSPGQLRNGQDSSSQDDEADSKRFKYAKNTLYEFDSDSKTLLNTIPIVHITNYSLPADISHAPFQLTIQYIFNPDSEDCEEQQEKTFVLLSDYLSQVHKWIKCLQIIETRYCLRKVREELKEMKFEKYEVTQWRINEEEWRVLVDGKSKNEKDLKDSKELEYLLMNKVSLKIAGHKYDLKDLQGESEVQKMELNKDGVSNKVSAVVLKVFPETKLYIVFASESISKGFRKKLKKLQKAIEVQQNSKKQMVELKTHDDLSTYYLDKKIRETMAGIKINFYETMDREVPAKKQVSQQEDSWWTRFLNMLCGEHQNQDLLAD